ncbi:MAG: hypothetical protein WBQ25_13210 [Nitrososphaeraceae archaeon]
MALSSSALLLSNQSALPTVTSLIPFSPTIVQSEKANVNTDTSGNGNAAAFDSKNSISSDGKGYCNTVNGYNYRCSRNSYSNNQRFRACYSSPGRVPGIIKFIRLARDV